MNITGNSGHVVGGDKIRRCNASFYLVPTINRFDRALGFFEQIEICTAFGSVIDLIAPSAVPAALHEGLALE